MIKQVGRFISGVKSELLKVSWPNYKEIMQVTLVVGIVITMISFLLWGMDSIIWYFIRWLVSQRG
jgi:preprotein translocase subunit SecE